MNDIIMVGQKKIDYDIFTNPRIVPVDIIEIWSLMFQSSTV